MLWNLGRINASSPPSLPVQDCRLGVLVLEKACVQYLQPLKTDTQKPQLPPRRVLPAANLPGPAWPSQLKGARTTEGRQSRRLIHSHRSTCGAPSVKASPWLDLPNPGAHLTLIYNARPARPAAQCPLTCFSPSFTSTAGRLKRCAVRVHEFRHLCSATISGCTPGA